MAMSVSIKKKYEDELMVIYNYGKLRNEIGEFSIEKASLNVQQIRPTQEIIDRMMYLSAAAKILKIMQSGAIPPEITSYNA